MCRIFANHPIADILLRLLVLSSQKVLYAIMAQCEMKDAQSAGTLLPMRSDLKMGEH